MDHWELHPGVHDQELLPESFQHVSAWSSPKSIPVPEKLMTSGEFLCFCLVNF
jgi:hypothetical protein